MKTLSRLSLIFVALSLGACGTRSADDDGAVADAGADASSPTAPSAVNGAGDEGTGAIFATDLPDAVADGDPDTTLDPVLGRGDGIDGGLASPLDPLFSTDSSSVDPSDAIDAGSVLDPVTGPDATLEDVPAVPTFPGRPDAARLHAALTDALGATLLDLNARVSGGMELSGQQRDCLGAYDAALGESALAVDCERALATEPLAIYIERGAFASTDACRASVASGTVEDCVLAFASAVVPTRFVTLDRRAAPVAGSGVVIRHGIDTGVFEVSREAGAPVEDFRCAIDIATGSVLPSSLGDCDAVLRDSALFVDSLFAPS